MILVDVQIWSGREGLSNSIRGKNERVLLGLAYGDVRPIGQLFAPRC